MTFVRVLCPLLVMLLVYPRPAAAQDRASTALATFDRVWETIDRAHYDPSFGGLDWAAVKTELRPRAARASDDEELRSVIREMLSRLGQSHFRLISSAPEEESLAGPATLPLDVRPTSSGLLVTRVTAGSAADLAGIRPGDRVDGIDGQSIREIVESVEAPSKRMADLIVWRRAMRALSGAAGSQAHLTVVTPEGTTSNVTIARGVEPGELVALGHLPPLRARITAEEARTPEGRRAGVIAFNIWMPAIAEGFADGIDRFRTADGLVIDLRGNPGGLADMMRGLAGHLIDEPALLGRMRMRDATLEFRANPRRVMTDGRLVEPFAGPVALLVDGLTGSASECFAGALQSLGRVRVFGTPTMGQALPASTLRLPNGDVLMYVVGDFVTSTGVRLEGAGVQPDEVVPLSPAALSSGSDSLHAALVWIDRAAARGNSADR